MSETKSVSVNTEERNPWTTLSSKEVYKNPWITVREDQVINPGGKPGIYGVVSTRIATGVIALDANDNITLVGQYRYPTDQYSWEIPEGGAEHDESPLVAAQRELREETGLDAAVWEQLGGEVHLSNCVSAERGFVYLATELTQRTSHPEETELLQVKSFPFTEALKMVDSGEIKDAVSIIAILRLARKLNKLR